MTHDYYRLVWFRPVPVSAQDWAKSYPTRWKLHTFLNGYLISTVFLGLNCNYHDGPPIVFETMVFQKGNWDYLYMTRCSTFLGALWMHLRGCLYVLRGKV